MNKTQWCVYVYLFLILEKVEVMFDTFYLNYQQFNENMY